MNEIEYQINTCNSLTYFYDGELDEETFMLKKRITDDLEHEFIQPDISNGIIYFTLNERMTDLSIFVDEGSCTLEIGECNPHTGDFSKISQCSLGSTAENNVLIFHRNGDNIECIYKNISTILHNTYSSIDIDAKNESVVTSINANNKEIETEILLKISVDKEIAELYREKYLVTGNSIIERLLELEKSCKQEVNLENVRTLELIEYDIAENLIKKESMNM